MRELWLKFWSSAGATGDPEGPWRLLSARYAEPHRAYHTLNHVSHCLRELEGVRTAAQDVIAVEMALWYHDAIYDPRRRDNEEQSAELAGRAAVEMGLDAARGARVADLIRVSVHREVSADPDAQLFADIDLAILGQPFAIFAEYERQIRVEYAWVPEQVFRAGRTAILESFLDRPSIYGTGHFQEQYEAMARLNLSVSLKRMR
jgi:predicted metal-dependent HD superfamily phosphohydrolase